MIGPWDRWHPQLRGLYIGFLLVKMLIYVYNFALFPGGRIIYSKRRAFLLCFEITMLIDMADHLLERLWVRFFYS